MLTVCWCKAATGPLLLTSHMPARKPGSVMIHWRATYAKHKQAAKHGLWKGALPVTAFDTSVTFSTVPATCQQLRLTCWHSSLHVQHLSMALLLVTINLTWQAAQEARLPEPEADLPAFAYGPGGSVSGAFGVWASAHQGWLGQPHLEALMKLTGNVSISVCMRVCVRERGRETQ